ncbi:MAG: hypothetical protein P4M11_04010 [Candidatus Pacebacteria bacterium]|nr:hypothetical protein [Candidatus Paceibacterota bacterium]
MERRQVDPQVEHRPLALAQRLNPRHISVSSQELTQVRDLVVVGLQDFAHPGAKAAFAGQGDERVSRWDLLIGSHLDRLDPKTKYMKFQSRVSMGLYICMYGKCEIAEYLSSIEAGKVKTSPKGEEVSSGAVIIRFAFSHEFTSHIASRLARPPSAS